MSQQIMIQFKSQAKKYGLTKHEDYLEQCFLDMGFDCKRRQVYCFMCLNMWTNESDSFPHECRNCGTSYRMKKRMPSGEVFLEERMFCMPDIVIQDPTRHGKGVIFVQSHKYHDDPKQKKKDQYQMNILRKNNWRVFSIYNEEIDYLKHANRCFWVLGVYRAMKDLDMYNRAFAKEKELLH